MPSSKSPASAVWQSEAVELSDDDTIWQVDRFPSRERLLSGDGYGHFPIAVQRLPSRHIHYGGLAGPDRSDRASASYRDSGRLRGRIALPHSSAKVAAAHVIDHHQKERSYGRNKRPASRDTRSDG